MYSVYALHFNIIIVVDIPLVVDSICAVYGFFIYILVVDGICVVYGLGIIVADGNPVILLLDIIAVEDIEEINNYLRHVLDFITVNFTLGHYIAVEILIQIANNFT